MKEATRIFTSLLLLLIFAALGFVFGRRSAPDSPGTTIVRDTVTCTVYDTIVRERPVYRISYVTDTVRTYFTTIQHDTVQVEVPIERKVYAEDSLYYAVVSGWRPSLDTLLLYPKTTTVTIHEKEIRQAPRWSFGATFGPSVLATPSGQVHAGLGVAAGLAYRF